MNTTNSIPCNNPDCYRMAATGPGRTGKYCSRSCAATINNKVPKRVKIERACLCGNKVWRGSTSNLCKDCRNNSRMEVSLGELRKKSVKVSQVYNTLRQMSRKVAISLKINSCEVCGYSKHVEVCHINALSELPDSTSIREAVSRSNFYVLCRNHHWEFDHGALIPGFEPGGSQ